MKPKRRAAYSEGSLYSVALCLPAVVLSLFLLSKVYDIKGKGDPVGIVIAVGYIVLYLVLFKYGRKLFHFTEKMYMSCGDEKKAHRKAVLTEYFLFFVFVAACMFIVTMLI